MAASDVIPPLLLSVLMYAGAIKGNPLLSWFPIDLTLLATTGLTLLLVRQLLCDHGYTNISFISLATIASFLPGLIFLGHSNYAHEKALGFLITFIGFASAQVLMQPSNRLRIWIWLQPIFGTLSTLLALHSGLNVDDRLDIVGGNTIATARLTGIAVVTLASLAMTIPQHRRARAFLIAATIPLCPPLISTGSRGPVLAAALTLAILAIAISARGRILRTTIAALVVATGYQVLTTASGYGAARIRLSLTGQINATEERNALSSVAWHEISTQPLGVGWGNFETIMPAGLTNDTTGRAYAHNVFLEAAAEGGWICGALLMVITAIIIWRLRSLSNTNHYTATLLAIVVFFLINALTSGDLNDNRTLWCALGVAAAVIAKNRLVGPSSRPCKQSRPRPSKTARRVLT